MNDSWDTLWRWIWFNRGQWLYPLGTIKANKRNTPRALQRILAGRVDPVVLDCSCGFGLKTIVMKELGMRVYGSDASAFAVAKARELAASEGLQIEYFTARWEDLPRQTNLRFDAIFNDALSWVTSREEFAASLAGFRDALKPGGILVFMGAGKDAPSDPRSQQKLLEDLWESRPKFLLEWSHTEGNTCCTSILAREKGDEFVDEHHIYFVQENGQPRIETATIRQPIIWHWPLLKEMFEQAGFADLDTRVFTDIDPKGKTFYLNVAKK